VNSRTLSSHQHGEIISGLMKPKHPYVEFEGSELWKVISKTVRELEKNGDFQLTTNSNYVVGFLCQQLQQKKLVSRRGSKSSK
jgi:hypothetical protein